MKHKGHNGLTSNLFIWPLFLLWGAIAICSLTVYQLPVNGADKAFLLLSVFGLVCWLVTRAVIRQWRNQMQATPKKKDDSKTYHAKESFSRLMLSHGQVLAGIALFGSFVVWRSGYSPLIIWGFAAGMAGASALWIWTLRRKKQ